MTALHNWRESVEALVADLRAVFDTRLRSLVVYEAHGALGDNDSTEDEALRHNGEVHTLAVVERLDHADLLRLAPLSRNWGKRGLSVPLILGAGELARSLDAFPFEFDQMMARHVVAFGDDPFAGLAVNAADLRRACETQARSHLLHLREGFIQTDGDPGALARLVAASAAPMRGLLVHIARLHGIDARSPDALLHFAEGHLGLQAESLRPVLFHKASERMGDLDVGAFFPGYLRAVEQLVAQVDAWAR
jgi:hypothetical protein